MTAPDEIHIKPNDTYENEWAWPDFTDQFDEDGTEYIRYDLHQSALADRDATIARLERTAGLDAKLGDELVKTLRDKVARLQAELIAKDDAWIADQTNNANEIIRLGDKLERLQARLDAGPSVEQLRAWEKCMVSYGYSDEMTAIANRMEAANGK